MAFTPLEKAGVGVAVAGGAAYAANAAVQSYIAAGPTIANSIGAYTQSSLQVAYNTAYDTTFNAALAMEATEAEAQAAAGLAGNQAMVDISGEVAQNIESIYGVSADVSYTAVNTGIEIGGSEEIGAQITQEFGSDAGSDLAAGSTGYITYIQALMAALSVIGFARLVPDEQVTMNGEKTVSQIGFFQAISKMISGAIGFVKSLATNPKKELEPVIGNIETAGISVTNAVAATGALLIAGAAFLASKSGSGTTNASASAATPAAIAVNPAADSLLNDMAAVDFYSTSTSTLFWSTSTATTVQGGEWWGVQQYFSNTGSSSLIATLGLALGWTNQLAGTVSNSSAMTLQQIIEAQSASSGTVINGIIQPSVPEFAGTLYYPEYINSCTTLISTLITIADTATTLPSVIALQIPILETARANLYSRVNQDVFNQSQYLSQSNHLANLLNQATIYNNIKNNQPADIVDLYQSTINAKVLDSINAVSTLQDLTSFNNDTVIAAFKTIQAKYNPTITGVPTTITRGVHFTISLGGGTPNGTATLTDYGSSTPTRTYNFDANGNMQINYVFETSRYPTPATLTIAFDNTYTQTYTIKLA